MKVNDHERRVHEKELGSRLLFLIIPSDVKILVNQSHKKLIVVYRTVLIGSSFDI